MRKYFVYLLNSFLFLFVFACGQTDVGTGHGNDNYDPSLVAGTQVGVVFSYEDAKVDTFFLTLADGNKTAKDAMDATVQTIIYADFGIGPATCKVNAVGMPADSCFGDLDGNYWAFFYKKFGTKNWIYADVGIGLYALQDGDLIGLLWTRGDVNNDFAPLRSLPDLKLSDIVTK